MHGSEYGVRGPPEVVAMQDDAQAGPENPEHGPPEGYYVVCLSELSLRLGEPRPPNPQSTCQRQPKHQKVSEEEQQTTLTYIEAD